jgi:hypothetical protein
MNSNENSHDPLVERVLVSFDLAAEHHISNCPPCQAERERVEDALRQFGAANREYAQRPERFWEEQASQIRRACRQSQKQSRITAALVPSVVVLLLAAFGILGHLPATRPAAIAQPAAQVDQDHELLIEVERVMQTDTPVALEPATLVVDQRNSGVPLSSRSERKETHTNEN